MNPSRWNRNRNRKYGQGVSNNRDDELNNGDWQNNVHRNWNDSGTWDSITEQPYFNREQERFRGTRSRGRFPRNRNRRKQKQNNAQERSSEQPSDLCPANAGNMYEFEGTRQSGNLSCSQEDLNSFNNYNDESDCESVTSSVSSCSTKRGNFSNPFAAKPIKNRQKFPTNKIAQKLDDKVAMLRNLKADYENVLNSITPRELVRKCREDITGLTDSCLEKHEKRFEAISLNISSSKGKYKSVWQQHLNIMKMQQKIFEQFIASAKSKLSDLYELDVQYIAEKCEDVLKDVRQECALFRLLLPIYAFKGEVISSVQGHQVTVISADANYSANTAVPFFLQEMFNKDIVVSCEPNSCAAVSFARSCSAICDGLSNTVACEVAGHTDKTEHTKILFTTVPELLCYASKTPDLVPYSCIIFNCDVRRTLKADFLFHSLRQALSHRKSLKLVMIVPPYIETENLRTYFAQLSVRVINTTNLALPVCTVWKKNALCSSSDTVTEVVQTALALHALTESGNDVIVYLPSDQEVRTVYNLLTNKFLEYKYKNVECITVHESDTEGSVLDLCKKKQARRKFVLATGWAELLPLPSVGYVIDAGIVKEGFYDSEKCVEVLKHGFISRARAKIRKMCAGRYHQGVCYRLFSKANYVNEMTQDELPDVLVKSPFNTMVQLFQYRPDNPFKVEFIHPVPADVIQKALTALKESGAVKDGKLSALGEQIVKLPYLPRYAKVIVLGSQWGFAFEAIVVVAFLLVGKAVFWHSDSKEQEKRTEAMKLQFLHRDSDTLTFLNMYGQWMGSSYSHEWCMDHCINFSTMEDVHTKVTDILLVVNECLKEDITPEILPKKETDWTALQELLFECFRDNLCVYSGHYRSGYQLLRSPCTTFFHPSSPVIQKGDLPQFLVFDSLRLKSRNFMLGVTAVPEASIKAAVASGHIDQGKIELLSPKLQPYVIEPVSVTLIKHVFLGKKGRRLVEIEEEIKKETKCSSIVIEPSEERGNITLYTLPEYREKAEAYVRDILKTNAKYILSEEETRILELKKAESKVPFDVKWEKGASVISVKRVLNSTSKSNKSQEEENGKEHESSSIKYCVNVTWPRRLCTGFAYVTFSKENFSVARRLAMRTVLIRGSEAEIQLNRNMQFQLYVRGLCPQTTDKDIKQAIEEKLENQISVESVFVGYEKPYDTTDEQLEEYQKKLEQKCYKHVDISGLSITVPKPKCTDTVMAAYINLSNSKDTEWVAEVLNGKFKFGNVPVQAVAAYSSVILCSIDIFRSLQQRFDEELSKFENDINHSHEFLDCEERLFHFSADAIPPDTASLKLSTNKLDIMNALHRAVSMLLEGVVVSNDTVRGLHKFFTHGGYLWLRTLEKKENVHIVDEYKTKTLRIYGQSKACGRAVQRIRDFIENAENEVVSTIDLRGRKNARSLLKALIREYGINMSAFIEKHGLRSVEVNVRSSKLTVHGSPESIENALDALEELDSKYSSDAEQLSSSQECCSTCGVPPLQLTLRLEHCGHLYCAECLRGLILNAQFPIKCCAEDCDKALILEDIRKGLDYDEAEINKLLNLSVTNYISKNREHIKYCPAPNCSMFFDLKDVEGEKYHCPLCLNDICVKCDVVFHHGLSCDMFQGSKKDPNYSYRVWLKEQNANSKQCPRCKTGIEKTEGCNHMTCYACGAHFCWLCCTAFASGMQVYNHLPYCPRNQGP